MSYALPQVLAAPESPRTAPVFLTKDDALPMEDRPRILVVDDENGPRQSLRVVLKEHYEVRLAEGVDEALSLLEQFTVNLIITDIRMPHRTGIDLLREVRGRGDEIDVILLTGYGELGTAMEAMNHGAFAYLEKPFDHQEMLAKVAACIERQLRERDRRAMERLAIEANRFSTLGRMMSGTMHDLGTPLSVLGANLEILYCAAETEQARHRLGTMRDQLLHCTDLVRTAMNFLRQPPAGSAQFSLNGAVEMCLDVARPVLRRHGVEVRKQLAADLPACRGELILVRQAVLNLIYNACQAMQDEAGVRHLILETQPLADGILLSVEDTGPGVPLKDRERIFGSMYTTKGKDGTGLGLTVVRNVMGQHGGTARLVASAGKGARFELQFPIPQDPAGESR